MMYVDVLNRLVDREGGGLCGQARLAAGEDVFSPLIRKYLLENPHRVSMVMQPDPQLGSQQEEQEQARLAAARANWDINSIEDIIEKTKALKERQVRLAPTGPLRSNSPMTEQRSPSFSHFFLFYGFIVRTQMRTGVQEPIKAIMM